MTLRDRLESKLNSYVFGRGVLELIASVLKWAVLAHATAIAFKVIGPELARIENFNFLTQIFSENFTDFFLYGFMSIFASYFILEVVILSIKHTERKIVNTISKLDSIYSVEKSNSDLKRVMVKRNERRYRPPG